jgi:hypothetical protein
MDTDLKGDIGGVSDPLFCADDLLAPTAEPLGPNPSVKSVVKKLKMSKPQGLSGKA